MGFQYVCHKSSRDHLLLPRDTTNKSSNSSNISMHQDHPVRNATNGDAALYKKVLLQKLDIVFHAVSGKIH